MPFLLPSFLSILDERRKKLTNRSSSIPQHHKKKCSIPYCLAAVLLVWGLAVAPLLGPLVTPLTTHPPESNHLNQENKDKPLSLAVVVAGSAQRLLLTSTLERVLLANPSSSHITRIDYFGLFTLQSGPAFRQNAGYMGHLATFADPMLRQHFSSSNNHSTAIVSELETTIRAAAMEMIHPKNKGNPSLSTVNIPFLRFLPAPLGDDASLVQEIVARQPKGRTTDQHPNHQEDASTNASSTTSSLLNHFPMMDHRHVSRTRAGNRNMVRLFALQEQVWEQVEQYERKQRKQPYDYVLFFRDDTYWMDDLDLHKLIRYNNADAWVLSCNARTPPLLPSELNDHAILLKRDKAHIMGRYLTTLANGDLAQCHDEVAARVFGNGNNNNKKRGCNSEMILRYLLVQRHQLRVDTVPQSLLPMERVAAVVRSKIQSKDHAKNQQDNSPTADDDDDVTYCYHKFCQSNEAPLPLPPDMQKCSV